MDTSFWIIKHVQLEQDLAMCLQGKVTFVQVSSWFSVMQHHPCEIIITACSKIFFLSIGAVDSAHCLKPCIIINMVLATWILTQRTLTYKFHVMVGVTLWSCWDESWVSSYCSCTANSIHLSPSIKLANLGGWR